MTNKMKKKALLDQGSEVFKNGIHLINQSRMLKLEGWAQRRIFQTKYWEDPNESEAS